MGISSFSIPIGRGRKLEGLILIQEDSTKTNKNIILISRRTILKRYTYIDWYIGKPT